MAVEKLHPNLLVHRYIDLLALSSAYVFLFFAWGGRKLAVVAFVVLIAASMLSRQFWSLLPKSCIVRWLGLFLTYLGIRTHVAMAEAPEFTAYHLEDANRLMYLGGFVFIGWVFRGNQKKILLGLLFALVGFWLQRSLHFPWHLLSGHTPWWEQRMELGLPSAIAFGQYAAASLLGLVILAPRILSSVHHPVLKWLNSILWAMFLFFSIEGVILSQSRGVWLMLIIIGLGCLLVYLAFQSGCGRHQSLRLISITVVISITIGYLNHETFFKRATTEVGTITNFLSGNLGEIKAYDDKGEVQPMGIRHHMLLFGLEHWKKNPLFGLGPGITKPLMMEKWPYRHIKVYNDLHNGYVEMLLRLGIVGFLMIAAIIFLLIREGWIAYRHSLASGDLMLFLFAALALHLLVTATNFRMLNFDWRYYWFLFGGALLSFERSFSSDSSPW